MSEEKIKGIIEIQGIKYYKDNFGILIVRPVQMEVSDKYINPQLDKLGEFIIKGSVPKVEIGDKYTIVAKQVIDATWGLQYNLIFMNQNYDLSDDFKQKIFLKNILTAKQLESLYETLDNPFMTIQNEDIETLTKVKGIGLTIANKLIQKYKDSIDFSEVYIKLDSLGLTDVMIKRLCESYGSPQVLVEKFEENPYILCEDIDGIGFKRADEYAIKYGIEKISPKRIKAFINYYLKSQANIGNSWVETLTLVDTIISELGDIDKIIIGQTLKDMDTLWWSEDKKRIGLAEIYALEMLIAHHLLRLLNAENNFEFDNWKEIVSELEKNIGFEYTDEQKEGVKIALENNVVVITGLAGTGKTTVTKAMLKTLESYHFCQTALAGRAAQRMAEVTGYEGQTIHRLLCFNPSLDPQWAFNEDNPLPYDIVIVDEGSMIGGELFYKLLQAIKTGSKLIILGDYGQLESIGTCNVFHDLLKNGTIPVVKLTKIHRQAQKSAIITESANIRNKHQIFDKDFTGNIILGQLQDLELDIFSDHTETAKRVLMQFKEKFATVGNILDIQVIVPQKEKGDACTYRLNNAIQLMYNKNGANEITLPYSKDKTYCLREGDKIINIKNNYKATDLNGKITPVFNGNIGIIERINEDFDLMVINFTGIGKIVIQRKYWSGIHLGYAITGHKMQGSSAKKVIIGLDYASYMLLTCEWLYTAITRAESYCVLCGENKAVRYAITKSNVATKQTHLKDILRLVH
jgi:exodeoxyribonuclease V alpha subunit